MTSRQFVTFDVANQFFGVPVETVQEVLLNEKYTPMPLAPDGWGGLFNLRGEVVGTVDLQVRFGRPPRSMSGPVVNVVVLVGGEPVSLLVDRIGLVADLDDAAFELPPDTLTGPTRAMIVGSYKTEDRLLLVLDVAECVNTARAAM
ncbi:chemotaxis protein CheW [Actinoplanes sp. M2I2]|uniref:chemotaxis protein CheW n=1 Tax=Actinoplanes sp. M2I2 TaxID=1734444 RepID=UPI00201FC777|nr:chemotaxis protein CheW [Actinoplanes sp. M2I2]